MQLLLSLAILIHTITLHRQSYSHSMTDSLMHVYIYIPKVRQFDSWPMTLLSETLQLLSGVLLLFLADQNYQTSPQVIGQQVFLKIVQWQVVCHRAGGVAQPQNFPNQWHRNPERGSQRLCGTEEFQYWQLRCQDLHKTLVLRQLHM